MRSRLGSDAPEVIHDVPELMRRHFASIRLHACRSYPVANHREDLAIGGAVRPLEVSKVRRLRVELFAERTIASGSIAMTSRALRLIQGEARGDRCSVRPDGVLDSRRLWMMMRRALRGM